MLKPHDTRHVETVLAYHDRSKHAPGRYAPSLGYMDWATQPDPFRRYAQTRVESLPIPDPRNGPPWTDVWHARVAPAPLTVDSLSELFYFSLAISAAKRIPGGEAWSLRVNPSSGNLHPTEAYVILGPVEGLCDVPSIWHYQPWSHALELRAEIPQSAWRQLGLPTNSMLIALSTIHWRESWKYGMRAFRYCHHDTGHALAALAVSAASLGWRAALTDASPAAVSHALGLADDAAPERECGDVILSIGLDGNTGPSKLDDALRSLEGLTWHGQANTLSATHQSWPDIDAVHAATRDASVVLPASGPSAILPRASAPDANTWTLVRRRRSAVEMDGSTTMTREQFLAMLEALANLPPHLDLFAGDALVHLVLFVHRVTGIAPGLYVLVRGGSERPLASQLRPQLLWEPVEDTPPGVALFLLAQGDAREVAASISCMQAIAAEGCFSLGMLTDFSRTLEERGPGAYPRFYWECGMLGQILYLESEAHGLRATGIGCFHDDQFHHILGIADHSWQSLYHFTVGGAIEDTRLLQGDWYGQTRPEHDTPG